ncbi:MAG: hypothetical protein O3A53_06915 [Acidobacteria bacterium]|nr:hypothetical protein [Acidobacteriota bacterium]MDA1234514.1 hypothetical protein [Acidobacteriota bacterium]
MKYVQVGIIICLVAIVALLGARYFEQPAPEAAVVAEVAPEPVVAPVEALAAPAPEPAPAKAKPEPVRAEKPRAQPPKAAAPVPSAVVPTPAPIVPPPPPIQIAAAPEPVAVAADPLLPEEAPQPVPPKVVEPRTVTLAVGRAITVRLNHTVSTERNQAGDDFQAVLDEPLVVDGLVIAEKGAGVEGKIVQSERAGRVRGRALLVLELTQLATQDGQLIAIETQYVDQEGASTQKKDAKKVGIGAGIGAAIGAVIGGGKGAAVGAATGAGAGAGTVAATRGEPVVLRPETRLEFRLNEAVSVTEKF